MNALILSLISALFFSITGLLSRKGLIKVDPLVGASITIFAALPILAASCLINGDLAYLYLIDQTTILFLALAGILHFIAGRTLSYYSTKIIGISRSDTLTSTSTVYAVVFSAFILREAVGLNLFLGAIFITLGTWLILLSTATYNVQNGRQKYHIKGIIMGLAAGIIWGLTPILIKVGVLGVKSAVFSTFISYNFAAMCCPIVLIVAGYHKNLKNIDKHCFGYLLATGATVCIAQIFLFTALTLANVSFVNTIRNAYPLFTLFLSYIFIQKIEMINLKTVIGILLSVLGIYLVILT